MAMTVKFNYIVLSTIYMANGNDNELLMRINFSRACCVEWYPSIRSRTKVAFEKVATHTITG